MKQSYKTFPQALAKGIRMLVLDIDGVMTAGDIVLSDQGEQLKSFNVRDGHGIKLLQRAGIEVAVLTGRRSRVVEHRCKELGIEHLIQGSLRKHEGLQKLCEEAAVAPEDCAYIGDDVIDLPAMALCRFSMAPTDAYGAVKLKVDWVSGFDGGAGAVRQACEGLLLASGHWADVMQDVYGVSPAESGWA